MDCYECGRLLATYERRQKAYSVAYRALAMATGTVSTDEYILINDAVQSARIDSEVARLELEDHHQSVHTNLPQD